MNKKQIVRQLNFYYYGCMGLTVLTAAIMYLLISKGLFTPIDPNQGIGTTIQTVAIATTLFMIPVGLFTFKKQCRHIRLIEDETKRERLYVQSAKLRILAIGIPLMANIFFYYMMGGYQSMIWLAAITAIALYFCKPNERKIDIELQSD